MRQLGKRMLLVTLLAGLLATAGCNAAAQYVDLRTLRPLSRAERLFREGEKLAQAGKLAESNLSFRQAVEADPKFQPALRRLAAAYSAQGRRRLAAYFYERLLATNPRDDEARRALVDLYRALGRPDKANEAGRPLGIEVKPADATRQAGLPRKWETFLQERAISGLAVGENSLFVTTQGGSLYALDREAGEVRWHFTPRGASPVVSGPAYSPAAEGGVVFFGAESGVLYAVSAADGRELWRFKAGAPIHGSPAVGGERVYFGAMDGTLYALDRNTGGIYWKFQAGGAFQAAPLVAGDTLYAGSLDENLYAIETRTGDERWRFAALAGVESTPLLAGDLLYFGANDSRVYCVNAKSARKVWHYSAGDSVYAQPVLQGERLYATSAGRVLVALAPQTGELLWRHSAKTFLTNKPAWDRGTLYLVANGDPSLYALDGQTGSLLWAMDTGDWPATDPMVTGGTLYLGERDGTVLAYALP